MMSPAATAVVAFVSAAAVMVGVGRIAGTRLPGRSPGAARRRGLLVRHPAGRRLASRLSRAGIPLGADAFAATVAGAAVGAGILAFAALRLPPAAPVAAGAVLVLATGVVRSADRRHLARIEAQLPGVTQQLAAALSAGLSLRQALTRAARDTPEPIGQELVRVVAELEMGARIDAALDGLTERVPAPDLGVMVTAILVQRRTGGSLARALAALSGRLEERAQLTRELQGATAQARMTAWMVAALPVGGGVMTELAAPGTLSRSLGQGPGPFLLVIAGALYAVGVVAIRRIGRIRA
jgi:tight adherence protein B